MNKIILKKLLETRKPIVHQCEGCDYIIDEKFCEIFRSPKKIWLNNPCKLVTNPKRTKGK